MVTRRLQLSTNWGVFQLLFQIHMTLRSSVHFVCRNSIALIELLFVIHSSLCNYCIWYCQLSNVWRTLLWKRWQFFWAMFEFELTSWKRFTCLGSSLKSSCTLDWRLSLKSVSYVDFLQYPLDDYSIEEENVLEFCKMASDAVPPMILELNVWSCALLYLEFISTQMT